MAAFTPQDWLLRAGSEHAVVHRAFPLDGGLSLQVLLGAVIVAGCAAALCWGAGGIRRETQAKAKTHRREVQRELVDAAERIFSLEGHGAAAPGPIDLSIGTGFHVDDSDETDDEDFDEEEEEAAAGAGAGAGDRPRRGGRSLAAGARRIVSGRRQK